MTRAEALTRLRAHEAELRGAGVGALWLFGSVARDEAGEGSDVDLFFEIGADKPRFDLFDLSGVRLRLIEIMKREVDLMTRGGIHHRRRERIEASAIQVF